MTARFIRPQHPKATLRPTLDSIKRVFALGWVAQAKMNGRRAQIHILPGEACQAFTRQGRPHTLPLSDEVDALLHQWFCHGSITVLDAEWFPFENKLFIFDAITLDGKRLGNLTFVERHALIFKDFIHPRIKVLPILKTAKEAWALMEGDDNKVEGIVLRSTQSKGWDDSAIVRCRKAKD